MADRAVGGYSKASLDYVPADPSTNSPAHARFHGSISTKLPPSWKVERTGMLLKLATRRRWRRRINNCGNRIRCISQLRSWLVALRSTILGYRPVCLPRLARQVRRTPLYREYSNRFHCRHRHSSTPSLHTTPSHPATNRRQSLTTIINPTFRPPGARGAEVSERDPAIVVRRASVVHNHVNSQCYHVRHWRLGDYPSPVQFIRSHKLRFRH